MGKRTKEEIMQDTINIKFEPMNVSGGNLSFKCTNTDWSMVAFDIKRDMLEGDTAKNVQFGDKELTYNCIYFLIGRVGVEERIYVGIAGIGVDGESALRRLRQHCDKTSRYYREHWSRVVVATHKEIDKLDIKELQGLER